MNDTVVTQNVSRLAAELSEKKFRFKPTALFKYFSYVCAAVAVVSLVGIVAFVLIKGIPNISLHLLFGEDSVADPSIAGAIVQTFKIVVVSLVIAVPIGVGCAVYLVEYTGRGNKLVKVIKTATETLAGVPSIVFGLFGLLFFVDFLGFGRGLWAGSFTITLMILPTIITSVEESLRAVSDTYREGSFGRAPRAQDSVQMSCCRRPCRAYSAASFSVWAVSCPNRRRCFSRQAPAAICRRLPARARRSPSPCTWPRLPGRSIWATPSAWCSSCSSSASISWLRS